MKESPSTIADEELLQFLMDWVRIYRNEGKLFGYEREYFKSIVKEVKKRKLLSKRHLLNPDF